MYLEVIPCTDKWISEIALMETANNLFPFYLLGLESKTDNQLNVEYLNPMAPNKLWGRYTQTIYNENQFDSCTSNLVNITHG